jgi:hypothetical protein
MWISHNDFNKRKERRRKKKSRHREQITQNKQTKKPKKIKTKTVNVLFIVREEVEYLSSLTIFLKSESVRPLGSI